MATVITGASAGIGAAIARRLAQSGYPLALVARRKEMLEKLREEIGSKNAEIYVLDITSKEKVETAFRAIEKRFGGIEILVNNAGLASGLDLAQNADLNEWERCIAVNVQGLVYCTHAALPSMMRQNRGYIVNIGSVAGNYPYPGGNVYCATKAFVRQFSLSLRADLLSSKVRVTCIEPGLLGGTEFSVIRFRGDAEKAKTVYERTTPLQPEDIAQIVQFCIEMPEHVNINTLEMMPTGQAFSALAIHKT